MPNKQKVNCTVGARETGLDHAVLSASSSNRWLECPPSALQCAKVGDTTSEFAMQGTDAHSLCEHKLKTALGQKSKDPTENLTFFDEEMADCSDMYAQYVMEQLAVAKEKCKDPIVLIEQHLDFSKWVPQGFGEQSLYIRPFMFGSETLIGVREALGASRLERSAQAVYDAPQVMLATLAWHPDETPSRAE